MHRPIEVQPLPDYRLRLRLRYENGVEGDVDLSDLAGRGVFALWNDRGAFEKVSIGSGGEIRWSDEVDLCPDALYMRVTGTSPEDLFPRLRQEGVAPS